VACRRVHAGAGCGPAHEQDERRIAGTAAAPFEDRAVTRSIERGTAKGVQRCVAIPRKENSKCRGYAVHMRYGRRKRWINCFPRARNRHAARQRQVARPVPAGNQHATAAAAYRQKAPPVPSFCPPERHIPTAATSPRQRQTVLRSEKAEGNTAAAVYVPRATVRQIHLAAPQVSHSVFHAKRARRGRSKTPRGTPPAVETLSAKCGC
jgi:hypothetical protein